MHPLEDFAEVLDHFLHIADTLQTAAEFRLLPQPAQGDVSADLYPFVLAEPVIAKVAFVADLVATAQPQPS
jgi:hypothetical protein